MQREEICTHEDCLPEGFDGDHWPCTLFSSERAVRAPAPAQAPSSKRWIHTATGAEVSTLGGCSIVYADPAWQYKNAGRGAAANHYATMPVEEICALPVAQLAAPDAVLFLWGTYALTPEALQVIDAWGFKFKTLAFDWVKYTAKNKEHFGLGKWTRGNPEPCWLGVRGNWPRRVDAGVRQLVNTYEIAPEADCGCGDGSGPHTDYCRRLMLPEVVQAQKREHSRKPVEVRQRIERLMGPDHTAVELFARERAEGWEAWGNQVSQTVVLTDSV